MDNNGIIVKPIQDDLRIAIEKKIAELNTSYSLKEANRFLYTTYVILDSECKKGYMSFEINDSFKQDRAFWTCFIIQDRPYLIRRTDFIVFANNRQGRFLYQIDSLLRVPYKIESEKIKELTTHEERLKEELKHANDKITKLEEMIVSLNQTINSHEEEIESLKRKYESIEEVSQVEEESVDKKKSPPVHKRPKPIEGFTWIDMKSRESRFQCNHCNKCLHRRYTKTHKCKK